ncbi:MAG: hypothetical protein ACNA7G_06950 [Methylobacter sp.]
MVYLTDVEAGGSTIFPNLGIEVYPRHLSVAEMVSKLIKDKEVAIVANLAYTSPEYDAYYRLDDATSYLD